VPVLCEGVYEPPSSRDTRAMKHASLVAFVRCAALRCVALRCAPPRWGGSNHPRDSYITVLISESWGQGGVEVHPMILINVSFL
jgi:hypothetical protein